MTGYNERNTMSINIWSTIAVLIVTCVKIMIIIKTNVSEGKLLFIKEPRRIWNLDLLILKRECYHCATDIIEVYMTECIAFIKIIEACLHRQK